MLARYTDFFIPFSAPAEVVERYGLLPTPDFVASFVVSRTLDPAIEAFGLERVRVIDPACGTGQYLAAAFRRLVERRQAKAPSVPAEEHARAALAQIVGVDRSPHAIALARLRLTLAYLDVAGADQPFEAPPWPLQLAVGDSLLRGELYGGYARAYLAGLYHAVLCTPPSIVCRDPALRDAYAAYYPRSTTPRSSLVPPFVEQAFGLAVPGGFVGLLCATAFSKREYGRPLVECFLPTADVTEIISLEGAFLPGIGSPSLFLFGRNQPPSSEDLSLVLHRHGEPRTPKDPAQGIVWSTIAAHASDEQGYDDAYIRVMRASRAALAKHPWCLDAAGPTPAPGYWLEPMTDAERRTYRAPEGAMMICGAAEGGGENPGVFVSRRPAKREQGPSPRWMTPEQAKAEVERLRRNRKEFLTRGSGRG